MMAAFTPEATNEDINDMMDECDTMLESLRAYEPDVADTTDKREYAATLKMYLEKINRYLDEMLRNIYLSPKDKQTLSKSLMVSLKFDKLVKKNLAGVIADSRNFGARFAQEAENMDDGDADGRFDAEAPVREDEEQGNTNRQPLSGNNGDPERERFGARNGSMAQPPRGYFGEGGPEADAAAGDGMVAPLDEAGAEQAMPAPRANIRPAVDALENVIQSVLEDLMTEEDAQRTLAETVAAHYPAGPEQFITEVVNGMEERGYSVEQIAEAADGSSNEIRTVFASFIAETGPVVGPARPEPAVRVQGPPVVLPPAAPAPPAFRNLIDDHPAELAALSRLGIPAYRSELRQYANTIPKVRQFAARLGLTPTYNPREGTAVKVAVAELIRRIQTIVPHY